MKQKQKDSASVSLVEQGNFSKERTEHKGIYEEVYYLII